MSDIAIKVDKVSKSFVLPHERQASLKSGFVSLFRSNTYEKQEVLKNVSFEIKEGEFVGIVGKNGSGKSTLLKLLAGIYSPDSGAIQVNGKLTPFIELGVGFNPELTGRENIFMNGALLGFKRKEMLDMYDDIVEFAELERFMDQKLKNYSSGMQVRLAFSIAIRANGDILLLDEVLAVGDAAFQQKCYSYFEELKRNKKTVILVSHDMSAVRRFCGRAIHISKGRIVFDGDTSQVANDYIEENIVDSDKKNDSADDLNLSKSYSIDAKIEKEDDSKLNLKISFKTDHKKDLFVGISILKDGTSIAEVTTEKELELSDSAVISYELDKTILGSGAYILTAALLKKENRELLAIPKSTMSFIVKNDDSSRSGALRLPEGWHYEKG